MTTIDTHCHASRSWFEPLEVLLIQMERNGVDKAVLVQHRGQYDNRYLLQGARDYPGRFAVTGFVETAQADAPDTLAAWRAEGMQSVRLTTPGSLGEPDNSAVWRKAAELDMPVSTPSTAEEVTDASFIRLVQELSDLPIILEHYGFLRLPEERWDSGYRELLRLAQYPNVFMKIHGFGEFMPRPFPAREPAFNLAEAPDYIDRAIAAFGADRLMLATDYPPSSSREGYGNVVGLLREYLTRWSPDEQAAILGRTAERLFGF